MLKFSQKNKPLLCSILKSEWYLAEGNQSETGLCSHGRGHEILSTAQSKLIFKYCYHFLHFSVEITSNIHNLTVTQTNMINSKLINNRNIQRVHLNSKMMIIIKNLIKINRINSSIVINLIL